jgi:hypothetical protein
MESAVRHFFSILILTSALTCGGMAFAAEVTLPKTTADQLKDACTKAGGRFSQDASGYDCGTNCQGGPSTDCTVHCAADQKCTAQVIGARRPRSVAEALTKPEARRR